MSYMAIATALIDVVPLVQKLIDHPKKGKDVAKRLSSVAQKVSHLSDPYLIAESFQNNPELLLEFYKKLMQTEKELYLAMLSDRESARKRTSLSRSNGMLIVSLCGLMWCLYLLAFGIHSTESIMLISTASGIFGSCLKDIYAFEFSSRELFQENIIK